MSSQEYKSALLSQQQDQNLIRGSILWAIPVPPVPELLLLAQLTQDTQDPGTQ